MLDIIKQIFRVGIKTETISGLVKQPDILKSSDALLKKFGRALAIRHVDAGSCNGCELELTALNNPYYNLEGYGIRFVASPKHADLLLVTGPVARNMETALIRAYEVMSSPKWVIALGNCGCTGGIFSENYATRGAVSDVIPVDLVIQGCPPNPTQIIQGIFSLFELTV